MKIEYGKKSRLDKDSLQKYGHEIGFSIYGDLIYCVEKNNCRKFYAVDSDDDVYCVKVYF